MVHVDFVVHHMGDMNGVTVEEDCFDCVYFRSDKYGVSLVMFIDGSTYSFNLAWDELPQFCDFFSYSD